MTDDRAGRAAVGDATAVTMVTPPPDAGPVQPNGDHTVTVFGLNLSIADIVLCTICFSLVAFAVPGVAGAFSVGRVAVLLVVIPAGLAVLLRMARRDLAALILVASVAWCIVTSALSPAPGLSMLGELYVRSGALNWAGAAAVWAIARRYSGPRTAEFLGWTLVGATALSSLVAIAQLFVQPGAGFLQLREGRPTGLAGHAIYVGAHASACCAWFAYRQLHRSSLTNVVGVFVFAAVGSAIGVRTAVLVSVLATLYVAFRARTVRAVALPVAVFFGTVVGTFAPSGSGTGSGSAVDRVASDGGLSVRLDLWLAGLRAWIDRPILGWGEARYLEATQSYVPIDFLRQAPWRDAHNLFVATVVGQGIVGLVLLVGFLAVAGRRARGATAWIALALTASLVLQPTPPATLALAALMLGVATSSPKTVISTWTPATRAGAIGLVVVGSLLAGSYVVAARSLSSVAADPTADASLPAHMFWFRYDPHTAATIALSRGTQAVLGNAAPDTVLSWRRRAVELDPESAGQHGELAFDLAYYGELAEATAEARRSMELQPHNPLALRALVVVASTSGDDELLRAATDELCEFGLEREFVSCEP